MVQGKGEVVKGNDYFSVQFLDSDITAKANDISIKNELSTFDYSNCEKLLRDHYNISENVPIKYSKIDFDYNLNKSSNTNYTFGNSVKINMYSSLDNKLLNSSICDQAPLKTMIPLTPIQDKINMIKDRLKDYKITGRSLDNSDFSDKNDPMYSDRCIKFTTKGKTLTINERIQYFYPNTSMSCESNDNTTCVFEGMDENYYARCRCLGNNEVKNVFTDALLESISDINIDIVTCHVQVLAFVIILLLTFLFTIFSLL